MNELEYYMQEINCEDCARKTRKQVSRIIRSYIAVIMPCIALFSAGLIFNNHPWLRLLFFSTAYLLVGWDIIRAALTNVTKGVVIDENFLMTVATLGAFLIGEYPESIAVMLFYKTGMLLEDMAVDKSRKSIKALIDIRPSYANLKTKDGIKKVASQTISIGDTIVVMPGERVPLDGVVSSGSSYLDTSPITGESMPRPVAVGDTALSGSINGSGAICIEVTKDFSQSTASKILDIVQKAASKKARMENFMSKFAKYYTPMVVAASLFTAVLPPIITGKFNFGYWLYRALVFLVISCPCALVISIPLSFFGGLGNASRKGILIKGSNYLDALNSVGTVVFDKTGTLTTGMFNVSEVVAANGYDREKVLEYAAMAEVRSTHPLAQSILKAYGGHASDEGIEEYEEISGYGVRMVSGGKEILAGNDKLLHMGNRIEHDTCNISGTVMHIAVDKEYVGYILFSDEIKEDSLITVNGLRELGVSSIVMFTGDGMHTAETVGRKLSLDGVHSSLLPHEKVKQFEILKSKNTGRKAKLAGKNRIMFVGDGINDAPILAMADIGVAMGALGSDAAIEASDIVLMTGQPSALVDAFKIARKTRRIVWQNIAIALGIKLGIMLLGAAGMATMWEAVFADVGVTLIAVFNSLRLLKLNSRGHNKP